MQQETVSVPLTQREIACLTGLIRQELAATPVTLHEFPRPVILRGILTKLDRA